MTIEINGDLYHTSDKKSILYHQDKVIQCMKHNVRLIHIYEYEVHNDIDKIFNYIKHEINKKVITDYEDLKLKKISKVELKYFNNINSFHTNVGNDICICAVYNGIIMATCESVIKDNLVEIKHISNLIQCNNINIEIAMILKIIKGLSINNIEITIDLDKHDLITYIKNGFSIKKITHPEKLYIYNHEIVNSSKYPIYNSGNAILTYNKK